MVCLGLSGALLGCAAAGPQSSATPAPITPPDGGVLLRDYGLTHAPANIAVPSGMDVVRRIDQPNVVTLFTTSREVDLPGYVRPHLEEWGYYLQADENGAMIFSNEDWQAAWTCGDQTCALTVRNLKAAPVTRGS